MIDPVNEQLHITHALSSDKLAVVRCISLSEIFFAVVVCCCSYIQRMKGVVMVAFCRSLPENVCCGGKMVRGQRGKTRLVTKSAPFLEIDRSWKAPGECSGTIGWGKISDPWYSQHIQAVSIV